MSYDPTKLSAHYKPVQGDAWAEVHLRNEALLYGLITVHVWGGGIITCFQISEYSGDSEDPCAVHWVPSTSVDQFKAMSEAACREHVASRAKRVGRTDNPLQFNESASEEASQRS